MSRYGGLSGFSNYAFNSIGFEVVSAATGSGKGENPEYTEKQFYSSFPQFEGKIEPAIINQYIDMAQGTVNSSKWGPNWLSGMGLYIAHLATLDLRVKTDSDASDSDIAKAGSPFAVAASKSVGDLSISYDYSVAGASGGGLLASTQYGQRYYDMARLNRGAGLIGW